MLLLPLDSTLRLLITCSFSNRLDQVSHKHSLPFELSCSFCNSVAISLSIAWYRYIFRYWYFTSQLPYCLLNFYRRRHHNVLPRRCLLFRLLYRFFHYLFHQPCLYLCIAVTISSAISVDYLWIAYVKWYAFCTYLPQRQPLLTDIWVLLQLKSKTVMGKRDLAGFLAVCLPNLVEHLFGLFYTLSPLRKHYIAYGWPLGSPDYRPRLINKERRI